MMYPWSVSGQEVDQRKLGETVEKDCRARGLNREDAMDRSRWRKQIGMIDDHDECEWVNVSSGTRVVPDKIHRAVNGCVVCVCHDVSLTYLKFLIFPDW